MARFWTIVGVFLGYTAFKADQLWPHHAPIAILLSAALFALMLGSTLVHRSNAAVFDRRWFRALAWAGSLTMATWMTFILISIPIDVVSAAAAAARVYRPEVLRHVDLGVFVASLVLVAVGFAQARRGPSVKEIVVAIPNLPESLRGFKIAHITDLHVSPTLRRGYVEEVVRRVNATEPDVVAFTGDLADGHAESIAPHIEPLRDLHPRHGSFFVTGNHEYYWGAQELVGMAKKLGFKPLLNENAAVHVDGRTVILAGVTDPVGEVIDGHGPDLAKAAITREKADVKILLAHRPGTADEAEPLGFDLQLSGHTHAGQFFPFSLLIGFFHKFTRGLYEHGRMRVYVNPGTGYWGPANRLGVAPEISLLTLS